MGRIFGEYLKQLRLDRKLTLREVEEKAQISNAYLSQVERGERSTPTMKILDRLAEVYGVSVSTLNEKALEELRTGAAALAAGLAPPDIPSPDTEFICRSYNKLSDEKKKSLMDYLSYLLNEEKRGKGK
ncbi:MAG: helix-turn-helix domain-containing protein [Candidatus Omnitrophica bacterium]|nr:helix-turn-helix domain-containing protein [Candidatus Omnitrophota bacterium]